MTSSKDISEGAITSLMNTWGNKKWFQIAVIVWIFLMPTLSIMSPIISLKVNKEQAKEVVVSTISEQDEKTDKNHKVGFEQSRHIYALAKNTLQEALKSIDCEYAFLIEYHNGAENIMTGIQFCKFDITLEVGEDVNQKVNMEKFRNENIAKYDILLSEELSKNQLLFYTKKQFEDMDKYLALQLAYINAKSYAIINLQNPEGKVFGTLLFVSINEHMNPTEIYNCTRKIESMFNIKEDKKTDI